MSFAFYLNLKASTAQEFFSISLILVAWNVSRSVGIIRSTLLGPKNGKNTQSYKEFQNSNFKIAFSRWKIKLDFKY